jgi:RNA polymerase sigma-70 factor, ECF subfamily
VLFVVLRRQAPLGESSQKSSQVEVRISYSDRSDFDLVARLGKDREDAYAEIYRRHAASVTAAARMILLDDQRCQTVVADVFVALWFFPQRFEPSRGSLLTFLRMNARARSIDILREEAARRAPLTL